MTPIPTGDYPGRTYKFFKSSTVYPFGYGVSYTQFKCSLASGNKSIGIKFHIRNLLCRKNGTQPPSRMPCSSNV
ncbi:hypothetical protein Pint_10022 [Pistacia integerrima]|uniref:Uncharacterized protein n=1 Tax=Pistacia integerrima TaxID=434235 RepID=A0ACC0XG76_9ROSI|nr:hypothetical protein Pint_10022 [Pistacia integerrima]